jgi:hypothetical protein
MITDKQHHGSRPGCVDMEEAAVIFGLAKLLSAVPGAGRDISSPWASRHKTPASGLRLWKLNG